MPMLPAHASSSSPPTACFRWTASIAKLDAICTLAEQYRRLVMVDDSHAVGFIGAAGRGTPELCAVEGKVDIYHRHTGQGPRRRLGRLYRRAEGHRRRCCASARARICSPIPWRRPLRLRRSKYSNCWPAPKAPLCANACVRTAQRFRRAMNSARFRSRARRASDHSGHARRCRAREPRWPTRCLRKGST